MKKAKTIKAIDIAKALNLSKATVSLALNGKPGVKEMTRERVLNCKKRMEEEQVLEQLRKLKIPCVIYDNDFESFQFDQILAHNRAEIRSAIRFLIEQGHKRMAYFSCQDFGMYNIRKRNQAAEQMRAECFNKGIELEIIPYENFDAFLKRLKQQKEEGVTAIVCSNIGVTERLVMALLQMGLRIPGDISLVGIDPAEVLTTEIAPTFVRGETVKGAIYYDKRNETDTSNRELSSLCLCRVPL